MSGSEQSITDYQDAIERLGSFALITSDLKFKFVTKSFTELFGYSIDDVKGCDLQYLDYAGSYLALQKQMCRQLYSGGTWIGETTSRHKDGSSVDTHITIAPSIHSNEIVGYVAQFQRSFIKSQSYEMSDILYRYSAGFNKIAALAIVNSLGVIEEVNDLFVELYGYNRSEIIGYPFSLLSSKNTTSDVSSRLWATILDGQVWSEEIETRRKDGRSIFVRSTVAPASSNLTLDVVASFDTFLVIQQDISMETELRANQNEIAIESARQQMLAGAIHNIANLQQSVLAANADALRAAKGLIAASQQAADHFKLIETDEERSLFVTGVLGITQGTAQQILDAAHAERKAIDDTVAVLNSFRRQKKNIRPVDDESISAFVQRTLNTFSLQAAQHNISICISAMVDGDVRWPIAQVQQIIFNLLINSQEAICAEIASEELSPHRGRIDLSIEEDGANVVFLVKDNGGGFHVPLSQLFTPRFTTKESGSGIGLHTSAIMAQSMGGSLTAKNVQTGSKRGALFELRLPRRIEAKGIAS